MISNHESLVLKYRAGLKGENGEKGEKGVKSPAITAKMSAKLKVLDSVDRSIRSAQLALESEESASIDLNKEFRELESAISVLPNRLNASIYMQNLKSILEEARDFSTQAEVQMRADLTSNIEIIRKDSRKKLADQELEIADLRKEYAETIAKRRIEILGKIRSVIKGLGSDLIADRTLSSETSYRTSEVKFRATLSKLNKEAGPLYRKHIARLPEIELLAATSPEGIDPGGLPRSDRAGLKRMVVDTKEMIGLLEKALYFPAFMATDEITRIYGLERLLDSPQQEYNLSNDVEQRILSLDDWRSGREDLRKKAGEKALRISDKIGIGPLSLGNAFRLGRAVVRTPNALLSGGRKAFSLAKQSVSVGRSLPQEAKSLGRQLSSGFRAMGGLFKSKMASTISDPEKDISPIFFGTGGPATSTSPLSTTVYPDSSTDLGEFTLGPPSDSPLRGEKPMATGGGSTPRPSSQPLTSTPSAPSSARPAANTAMPAGLEPIEEELSGSNRSDIASVNKKIVRLSRQISIGFESVLRALATSRPSTAPPSAYRGSGITRPTYKPTRSPGLSSFLRYNKEKSSPNANAVTKDDFEVQRADAERGLLRDQVKYLARIADSLKGMKPGTDSQKGGLLSILTSSLGSMGKWLGALGEILPGVAGAAAAWKFLKGGAGKLVTTLGRGLTGAIVAGGGTLLASIRKMGSGLLRGGITALAGNAVDAVLGLFGVGKGVDEDQLVKADDANWDRASIWEKFNSAPSRIIERAGDLLGLGNMATEARRQRVAQETSYLDDKQRNSNPRYQQSTARKAEPSDISIQAEVDRLTSPQSVPTPLSSVSVSTPSMSQTGSTPASSSGIAGGFGYQYDANAPMASGIPRTTGANFSRAGSTISAQSSYSAPAGSPAPAQVGESGLYNLKGGSNMAGLNPGFRSKFVMAVKEYRERGGKFPVNVNRAFATREQQAELYAKYGPGRAAPPGRSLHEFGYAIDIDSQAANDMDKMGILAKYGISRPVSGEPWHLQQSGITSALAKQGIYSADAAVSQGGSATSDTSVARSETAPPVSAMAATTSDTKMQTASGGGAEQAAYEPRAVVQSSSKSGGVEYQHRGKGSVQARGSGNSTSTIPTFSFLDPGMMVLNVGALA